MSIQNDYTDELTRRAHEAVGINNLGQANERTLRHLESKARNEIIALNHDIDYHLRLRDFIKAD